MIHGEFGARKFFSAVVANTLTGLLPPPLTRAQVAGFRTLAPDMVFGSRFEIKFRAGILRTHDGQNNAFGHRRQAGDLAFAPQLV